MVMKDKDNSIESSSECVNKGLSPQNASLIYKTEEGSYNHFNRTSI